MSDRRLTSGARIGSAFPAIHGTRDLFPAFVVVDDTVVNPELHMRHNTRPSSARAIALRMDSSSIIEPAIAFLLAMFVSWAISAL